MEDRDDFYCLLVKDDILERHRKEAEDDTVVNQEVQMLQTDERGRQAIYKELAALREKSAKRDQAICTRKQALAIERERARQIAALPPPLPRSIKALLKEKAAEPKFPLQSEIEDMMPHSERIELKPFGLENKENEILSEEEELQKKMIREERDKISQQRFKEALKKEHTKHEYNNLLAEMEHLEQKTRRNYAKTISNEPGGSAPCYYPDKYKYAEKQAAMEDAVEKIYPKTNTKEHAIEDEEDYKDPYEERFSGLASDSESRRHDCIPRFVKENYSYLLREEPPFRRRSSEVEDILNDAYLESPPSPGHVEEFNFGAVINELGQMTTEMTDVIKNELMPVLAAEAQRKDSRDKAVEAHILTKPTEHKASEAPDLNASMKVMSPVNVTDRGLMSKKKRHLGPVSKSLGPLVTPRGDPMPKRKTVSIEENPVDGSIMANLKQSINVTVATDGDIMANVSQTNASIPADDNVVTNAQQTKNGTVVESLSSSTSYFSLPSNHGMPALGNFEDFPSSASSVVADAPPRDCVPMSRNTERDAEPKDDRNEATMSMFSSIVQLVAARHLKKDTEPYDHSVSKSSFHREEVASSSNSSKSLEDSQKSSPERSLHLDHPCELMFPELHSQENAESGIDLNTIPKALLLLSPRQHVYHELSTIQEIDSAIINDSGLSPSNTSRRKTSINVARHSRKEDESSAYASLVNMPLSDVEHIAKGIIFVPSPPESLSETPPSGGKAEDFSTPSVNNLMATPSWNSYGTLSPGSSTFRSPHSSSPRELRKQINSTSFLPYFGDISSIKQSSEGSSLPDRKPTSPLHPATSVDSEFSSPQGSFKPMSPHSSISTPTYARDSDARLGIGNDLDVVSGSLTLNPSATQADYLESGNFNTNNVHLGSSFGSFKPMTPQACTPSIQQQNGHFEVPHLYLNEQPLCTYDSEKCEELQPSRCRDILNLSARLPSTRTGCPIKSDKRAQNSVQDSLSDSVSIRFQSSSTIGSINLQTSSNMQAVSTPSLISDSESHPQERNSRLCEESISTDNFHAILPQSHYSKLSKSNLVSDDYLLKNRHKSSFDKSGSERKHTSAASGKVSSHDSPKNRKSLDDKNHKSRKSPTKNADFLNAIVATPMFDTDHFSCESIERNRGTRRQSAESLKSDLEGKYYSFRPCSESSSDENKREKYRSTDARFLKLSRSADLLSTHTNYQIGNGSNIFAQLMPRSQQKQRVPQVLDPSAENSSMYHVSDRKKKITEAIPCSSEGFIPNLVDSAYQQSAGRTIADGNSIVKRESRGFLSSCSANIQSTVTFQRAKCTTSEGFLPNLQISNLTSAENNSELPATSSTESTSGSSSQSEISNTLTLEVMRRHFLSTSSGKWYTQTSNSSTESVSAIVSVSKVSLQSTPIKSLEEIIQETGIMDEPDLTLITSQSTILPEPEILRKALTTPRSIMDSSLVSAKSLDLASTLSDGEEPKSPGFKTPSLSTNRMRVAESPSMLSFLDHERRCLVGESSGESLLLERENKFEEKPKLDSVGNPTKSTGKKTSTDDYKKRTKRLWNNLEEVQRKKKDQEKQKKMAANREKMKLYSKVKTPVKQVKNE